MIRGEERLREACRHRIRLVLGPILHRSQTTRAAQSDLITDSIYDRPLRNGATYRLQAPMSLPQCAISDVSL